MGAAAAARRCPPAGMIPVPCTLYAAHPQVCSRRDGACCAMLPVPCTLYPCRWAPRLILYPGPCIPYPGPYIRTHACAPHGTLDHSMLVDLWTGDWGLGTGDWTGLDWTGLGWTGLGWTGL